MHLNYGFMLRDIPVVANALIVSSATGTDFRIHPAARF